MDQIGIEGKSEELFREFPVHRWNEKALHFLLDQKKNNQRVAVACSGGADSVFALLLCYSFFKNSLHVLHVNHDLRGVDSKKDASFVENLSNSLHLKSSILKVGELGKKDEGSLREARLSMLLSELEANSMNTLIQGHQQDDVAESLLWRISRGAGPFGLCSPRPLQVYQSAIFIRPFITIPKNEITEALARLEIPWVEDQSNHSFRYLRNRIRHNTIRSWKKEVDRDLLGGVQRTRDLIEEQNEAIEYIAKEITSNFPFNFAVSTAVLKKYPRAVQRFCIHDLVGNAEATIAQDEVTKIMERIENFESQTFTLNEEFKIVLTSDELKLVKSEIISSNYYSDHSLIESCPLYFPEKKVICRRDFQINKKIFQRIQLKNINQEEETIIDAGTMPCDKLIIKSRDCGDKFQPLGMKGPKKLKDLFIDRKWTRQRKDQTPVFCDSNFNILWIPGFGPCEHNKITPRTKQVIHLTYQHSSA